MRSSLWLLGLLAWGYLTSIHFSVPLFLPTAWGLGLLVLGGCLFVWSMASLMPHGQGLPMNAFPPPCFVRQGPYRLFSHPIYVGFCLMALPSSTNQVQDFSWWPLPWYWAL